MKSQPIVLPKTCFSSAAGSDGVDWTEEEENALVRKFDKRILPGLSALYLLCFLDRTYDIFQGHSLTVGTLETLGALQLDEGR